MVYLASPYRHPDYRVVKERFEKVCKVTASLLSLGQNVFSPIVYSGQLVEYGLPQNDWDFWKKIDLEILSKCDCLFVLTIEGWDKSLGVKEEMEYAKKNGIPIRYINETLVETSGD